MSISFIIPSYNTAEFIGMTIQSVLREDLNDIEVIIVDDNSSDGTADMINAKFGDDPRVKLIPLKENTPGGAGAPSNIGIDAATKDYIAFVDSDDWITKGYFETLARDIQTLDVDVVVGSYTNVDALTHERMPPYDNDVWPKRGFKAKKVKPERLLLLSPEPWRKIYKRSFLNAHALRFPVNGMVNEDYPLHWMIAIRAETAAISPAAGYFHRVNRAGQTTIKGKTRHHTFFAHTETICDYIKTHGKPIHWQYLQNWIMRHSHTLAAQPDPDAARSYFEDYSALLDKLPYKKISGILAKHGNWRTLPLFWYVKEGDFERYMKNRFSPSRTRGLKGKMKALRGMSAGGIASATLKRTMGKRII